MITFTAIDPLPSFRLDARRTRHGFDLLRVVPAAIVVQTPRSCVARPTLLDAHNDIAIPWPGVIPVIFTGTGRGVGMGMIPPDQFQLLLPGGFFGQANVICGHLESVARRVIAPIR